MSEFIKVEGIVDSVIFYNAENGYAVFSVVSEYNADKDESEEVMCVGYLPNINEGESISLTGTIVVHPTYGEQLQVEIYEKTIPKSEKGIERYLASGVIKGIGPKMAQKIIQEFGVGVLEIMEKDPERLVRIRGISLDKARSIGEIFHEQAELRRAMLFLQDYGITPAYALKIYKKYKDKTIITVETNPYSLAEEIFGIGFKIADDIAKNVGIEQDSPYRIKAGIKYILNHSSNNGNVYLPMDELVNKTVELLALNPVVVENMMTTLHIENQIWIERDADRVSVYLNYYYYAESYVAKRLIDFSRMSVKFDTDYDREINLLERQTGIVLANEQRDAVVAAMANGVLVVTGGPGTGKTTIINTIIKLLQTEEIVIELAAPTGRAAKRMTAATGIEAKTIHRLLGITFVNEDSRRQSFDKDEKNPIEADVIIIDESSMVDILLMDSLLKAIAHGTRLILVGDVNQLPSVGPGNVLKDIINSGVIKVVKLNEIFRQAQESAIIMNAHRINNGQYPVINDKDKDFFFMKRYDVNELINTIVSLVTKRLPSYLNCDGLIDIQILAPMRKSPLGIANLNNVLQKVLNPPSNNKREKQYRGLIFREGDKVMQIKNNYNMTWSITQNGVKIDEGMGVFNGDEGIINYIDTVNEYIEVLYDDNKKVKYDYTQLDELELSYAITIHKSQGSEYKVVIIPIHSGPDMLFSRNLLYTAVTRAKELAVIVGIPEMMYKMVDNNKEINRYTGLKDKLIEFMEV